MLGSVHVSQRGHTPGIKLLIVGIDGFTSEHIGAAPYLSSLLRTGRHERVWVEVPTISGPGWSSLLTGSTHAEHGVQDNLFVGSNLGLRVDILDEAFRERHDRVTFAAVSWPPLADPAWPGKIIKTRSEQIYTDQHRVVVRDGEMYGYRAMDAEITDTSVPHLRRHGADVSFVYLGEVDQAGHTYGLGAEYDAAIGRVDAHVTRLAATIENRAASHGERWMLAVMTDHGHVPEGGHGSDSQAERASFLMLQGFGGVDVNSADFNQKITTRLTASGFDGDEPGILAHEVKPLLLDLLRD